MNKEDILSLKDLKTCPVEVPEWDTTVHVRMLTAGDVAKVKAIKDEVAQTVALVCAALCDEHGTRLFNDSDADRLKGKSWTALERVAMKAITHNAMGPGAVDDAKKN